MNCLRRGYIQAPASNRGWAALEAAQMGLATPAALQLVAPCFRCVWCLGCVRVLTRTPRCRLEAIWKHRPAVDAAATGAAMGEASSDARGARRLSLPAREQLSKTQLRMWFLSIGIKMRLHATHWHTGERSRMSGSNVREAQVELRKN
jgi:hypothetical protein